MEDGEEPVAQPPAVIELERELALMLRRARAFSWQFAREFHPELDAGAYGLLLWLDDQGSARLTDMAAFFGVGKPTVSRQIHLLERLDLITRSADPDDGRAQIIQLTAGGAARLHEVREARRARFRTLFEEWPADDVETLAGLLGRLNGVLGGEGSH
jgi:DNA-binding MarR family transcriptional regulator